MKEEGMGRRKEDTSTGQREGGKGTVSAMQGRKEVCCKVGDNTHVHPCSAMKRGPLEVEPLGSQMRTTEAMRCLSPWWQ